MELKKNIISISWISYMLRICTLPTQHLCRKVVLHSTMWHTVYSQICTSHTLHRQTHTYNTITTCIPSWISNESMKRSSSLTNASASYIKSHSKACTDGLDHNIKSYKYLNYTKMQLLQLLVEQPYILDSRMHCIQIESHSLHSWHD